MENRSVESLIAERVMVVFEATEFRILEELMVVFSSPLSTPKLAGLFEVRVRIFEVQSMAVQEGSVVGEQMVPDERMPALVRYMEGDENTAYPLQFVFSNWTVILEFKLASMELALIVANPGSSCTASRKSVFRASIDSIHWILPIPVRSKVIECMDVASGMV